MPKKVKTVRNFWIEVEIDGRAVRFAAGPGSKDGGYIVRIYQRGAPSECEAPVITLTGVALDRGALGPALLETRAWIRPNTEQQHQIGFVKTDRGASPWIEWSPCK